MGGRKYLEGAICHPTEERKILEDAAYSSSDRREKKYIYGKRGGKSIAAMGDYCVQMLLCPYDMALAHMRR